MKYQTQYSASMIGKFQIINCDSCHQVKGYSVSSLGELSNTLPPHLQVLNTVSFRISMIAFFPGVIIEQLVAVRNTDGAR